MNEQTSDTPVQHTTAAPKRKKRLRVIRILLLAACVLIITCILSTFALAVFFPTESLRNGLEQSLAEQSGLSCKIKSINTSVLSGGFTADDISMHNNKGELLLALKHVTLKVSPLSALSVLWGGTLNIEKLQITGGSVSNELPHVIALHRHKNEGAAKPAGTAVIPAAQPAKNASTPENSVSHIPNMSFEYISAEELSLFRTAGTPVFTLKTLQITPQKNGYYLRGKITENNSPGEAILEGKIKSVNAREFEELQVEATLSNVSVPEIYRVSRLPQTELTVLSGKCDGKIIITGTPQQLKSDIDIKTSDWSIKQKDSVEKVSPATIKCAINLSPEHNQIKMERMLIKTTEGVTIDGKLNFLRQPDGEWHGEGKISETTVPWEVFSKIIRQQNLQNKFSGNVTLNGDITLSHMKWDFTGNLKAPSLKILEKSLARLPPAEFNGKLSIYGTSDTLRLESINIKCGSIILDGNLTLPLSKQAPAENHFACHTTLECPLPEIAPVLGDFSLTGKLQGNIDLAISNGNVFTSKAFLKLSDNSAISNKANTGKIGATEIVFDTAFTDGLESVKVNAFSLSNGILQGALQGKFSSAQKSSGKIIVKSQPEKLYELLSITGITPPKLLRIISSLSGSANLMYDPKISAIAFNKASVDLETHDPAARKASISGDIFWVPMANEISLKRSKCTIIDDKKAETILEGNIEYAPSFLLSDTIFNCDITARGLCASFNPLLAAFAKNNESPLRMEGSAAVRIQANTRDDTMRFDAAIRTLQLQLFRGDTQLLDSSKCSSALSGIYNFPQRELQLKSAVTNFNAGDFLLSLQPSTFKFNDHIYSIMASCTANLEKCTYLFPALKRQNKTISGLLTSQLSYRRKADGSSSFTLQSKAPSIGIFEGAEVRKLSKPELKLNSSWGTDQKGTSWFKLGHLSLLTADEAFAAQGNSSGIKISEEKISFGSGAVLGIAMRGSDHLLHFISPALATKESVKNSSYEVSAKVHIDKIPLKSTAGMPRPKVEIYDGKVNLKTLELDKFLLNNIQSTFSLDDGILQLQGITRQLGGTADFQLRLDTNKQPLEANAEIKASGIELTKILPNAGQHTTFKGGTVFLPWSRLQQSVKFTWKGETIPQLLQTLDAPLITLHGENIQVRTKLDEPHWKALFEQDMHASMADEMARRMSQQFASRYKEPIEVFYKYLDAECSYKNGILIIQKCRIGGGNTSDFEATGMLYADGSLQLRVFPVGNMHKTFDLAMALKMPGLDTFLAGLPASQRKKAEAVLPKWLEQAATRKSFYVDVNGNADSRVIDLRGVRNGLKNELPSLIKTISDDLGEDELLKGVLGDENFQKINKLLKNF